MGEEGKRWSVTYTKHLKQKRKVHHDGFLVLLPNNNKVMLYDESEQLLDTMFLSKHHQLHSGDSIQFPAFLVDIGLLHSQPNSNSNSNSNSNYTPHFTFSNQKQASSITRSPSHTFIKEFKKNQALKYTMHRTPPSTATTSPSFKEWEALYTAQITKKSKKYYDGYLRLLTCGSRDRQIVLYDLNKNQLDKRFLKKDEIISEGESTAFDSYLVDIGVPVGGSADDIDVKMQGINCKVTDGREKVAASCGSSGGHPEQDMPVESNLHSLKVNKMDVRRRVPCHKPLRDAYQILSILKKPDAQVAEENLGKQYVPQYSESVLCKDVEGSLAESKDRKVEDEEGYKTCGNQPQAQHYDLPTPAAVTADNLCNKIEIAASSQQIEAKYNAVESRTKTEQEVEFSHSDHILPTCTVANLVSSLPSVSREESEAYQDQCCTTIPESDMPSEEQVATPKCSSKVPEIGNLVKAGHSQPVLDYPSFDLGF